VEESPSVDLRAVPWEKLLDELDKRGIATVDFESVPNAILRREFGRRLREKRAMDVASPVGAGRQPPLLASERGYYVPHSNLIGPRELHAA